MHYCVRAHTCMHTHTHICLTAGIPGYSWYQNNKQFQVQNVKPFWGLLKMTSQE